MKLRQELKDEAVTFITQCYHELNKSCEAAQQRITQIHQEIDYTDTYIHTAEELSHGAKMAWRNSNRCIGRLFWSSLQVRDVRHITTASQIINTLLEHIATATNDGHIKPIITIFSPASVTNSSPIRIWNHQLIRYAGYKTGQGKIIGDAHSIPFTRICQSLGWQGKYTPYDVLPLVIQTSMNHSQIYPIPKHYIKEIEISHPNFTWFSDLKLQWYAVPIISDMRLEIGGISYPAAPFNGWYMGTEIGARNLADQARYNLLPIIAEKMGLNLSSNRSLWKDKALIELNIAVLHSFQKAGVTIVDHHTAAQQFITFQEQQQLVNRTCTGDWTWLIPPVSPATTPIFYRNYPNTIINPNFYHQPAPYTI